MNFVHGVQPPPTAEQELELLRETRVTLRQVTLRSEYCSRLNSYLSGIDPNALNTQVLKCPFEEEESAAPNVFPVLRPKENVGLRKILR